MSRIPASRLAATAAFLAAAAFAVPAWAQTSMGSREFQAAELTELSPAIRAEVERRVAAGAGNTARGVLETMLLNELQVREPGSRIVGVDMGRGVVVVQQTSGPLKAYTFNKQEGLRIVGEVSLAR